MPISKFDSLRAQVEETIGYRDGESMRGAVQNTGEKFAGGLFRRIGCLVPIVGGQSG